MKTDVIVVTWHSEIIINFLTKGYGFNSKNKFI